MRRWPEALDSETSTRTGRRWGRLGLGLQELGAASEQRCEHGVEGAELDADLAVGERERRVALTNSDVELGGLQRTEMGPCSWRRAEMLLMGKHTVVVPLSLRTVIP